MRRPLIVLSLGLLFLGCPSDDSSSGGGKQAPGGKASSAAKDFLSFAKGGSPSGPDKGGRAPAPAVRYTIARNVLVPGDRPLRRVELQVPFSISAGALEATLRAASRRSDLGEAALLELWAHPETLRHLSGPFGVLTVARDGKGVPRTEGLNERLLIEEQLGIELDLDEARAVSAMDRAAGEGGKPAAIAAAGVAAGLSEDRAKKLLEKLEEHYPPPAR